MTSFELTTPTLGFFVGTRAALAFGVGLLMANHFSEAKRRRIGMAMVGLGAATTFPAIRSLVRGRINKAEGMNM